jgi:hypothetical protein
MGCQSVVDRPVGAVGTPPVTDPDPGQGNGADAGQGSLSGNVISLTGSTLLEDGIIGDATLLIEAPNGSGGTSETEYDGDDPFNLSPVLRARRSPRSLA